MESVNVGIHVKVQYKNEYRRFIFDGIEFNKLVDNIGTSFGKQNYIIKYIDDETDLVTISSDEDLKFAINLFPCNILRLKIFPQNSKEFETSSESDDKDFPNEVPKKNKINRRSEKFELKRSKLVGKRDRIRTRLGQLEQTSDDLKVQPKNEKLQMKLQKIESRLSKFGDVQSFVKTDEPDDGETSFYNENENSTKEKLLVDVENGKKACKDLRLTLKNAHLALKLKKVEIKQLQMRLRNGDLSVKDQIEALKSELRQAGKEKSEKRKDMQREQFRSQELRKQLQSLRSVDNDQ